MTTDIEWTDETWNPTVGCSRVSPGCDGCYAIGVAHRAMQPAHRGLTVMSTQSRGPRGGVLRDARPDWTGEVRLLPDRLDTPLHWRKPRRVFVDSMSDLFHPDVPMSYVARMFATMAATPQHTYMLLTKRPQRMATMLGYEQEFRADMDDHRGAAAGDFTWPLPNVWLGVSVENQRYADLRIHHLMATRAAVRFLSVEPLLGPVDISPWLVGPPEYAAIDWVIVGGESGPGARPMHPQWARDIRDQCVAAGVPYFFKQWGAWAPGWADAAPTEFIGRMGERAVALSEQERIIDRFDMVQMSRVGKKIAGRELDGRTWDEMPA